MMKLTTARYHDGEIRAYPTSGNADGPLEPVATYLVQSDDKILGHTVAPDLDRAAYATYDHVMCIGRDGQTLWCYEFKPRSASRGVHNPNCVFSLDRNWVWVYRADAMADRGPDMLVVLRATTGEEVANAELDSVGQGGLFALHPDGRQVLLDVGEGQDGVKFYLAALRSENANFHLDLHSFGWNDRCLLDLAPDGRSFMTVDHGRFDVAFHTFPDGEELQRLSIQDLGYDYDESSTGYNGGFLSPDIAMFTVTGEADNKEWYHYYKVSPHTGQLLGPLVGDSLDNEDFEALGDGTWISFGPDGNAVRHRLPSE